ncbi:MAG TPA: DUF983 domain-containing protein [Candidatus Acidoferrales bacterium]|nr:DUF983 domain-containing protein [Candidatus Acidoferrales bacterium]
MKPGFRQVVSRGLRFRCPKCGQGHVFSSFFKMRDECAVCSLSFYPESGYYAGAMYLDYGLSAIIFLAVFIPTLFMPEFTGLSYVTKNLLWIAFGAVLCLAMARPSYSLWLAVDYWISPWNSEPLKKNDNTMELPLVSLVIRTDSGEPHPGTRHRPEN